MPIGDDTIGGGPIAGDVSGATLTSPYVPTNPPQLRGLLNAGVPVRGTSGLNVELLGIRNASVPLRGDA